MNCCSQEKETCSQLFLGEENMYSVHYCYQEKETGALMFQEKGSGAILFQEKGSGTLQTAVLKEKETGALLLMFSGEVDWCSLLYCSREKGVGLYLSVFIGFIYIKP